MKNEAISLTHTSVSVVKCNLAGVASECLLQQHRNTVNVLTNLQKWTYIYLKTSIYSENVPMSARPSQMLSFEQEFNLFYRHLL